MVLLDGKHVSEQRNLQLKDKIEEAKAIYHRPPKLSLVLVGDHPASLSYVRGKRRASKLVGMESDTHLLPEDTSPETLHELITSLNQDDTVDGILLQLPLPKHLDEDEFINLISKDKDTDGFHVVNQGNLYQTKPTVHPATPKGIMTLIDTYNIDVRGMHAVIVGRSAIVGFPVARLLMDRGATITVCHSKTKDLTYHTKQADLIVMAVGRPELLTKDMVKEGVIVIDVGINRVDGKLVGDANFDDLKDVASYLTPVPGGVGPMTIHSVLENTYELYLKHLQKVDK